MKSPSSGLPFPSHSVLLMIFIEQIDELSSKHPFVLSRRIQSYLAYPPFFGWCFIHQQEASESRSSFAESSTQKDYNIPQHIAVSFFSHIGTLTSPSPLAITFEASTEYFVFPFAGDNGRQLPLGSRERKERGRGSRSWNSCSEKAGGVLRCIWCSSCDGTVLNLSLFSLTFHALWLV